MGSIFDGGSEGDRENIGSKISGISLSNIFLI